MIQVTGGKKKRPVILDLLSSFYYGLNYFY